MRGIVTLRQAGVENSQDGESFEIHGKPEL
jgi:hypothetical protein